MNEIERVNVLERVTIVADGGIKEHTASRPRSVGTMYASAVVKALGTQKLFRWRDLGHGTNNRCEYLAIINAVSNLYEEMLSECEYPSLYHLEIRTDSKLIVNQVNGTWRRKSPQLHILREFLVDLLNQFGSWNIQWWSRVNSEKILGH